MKVPLQEHLTKELRHFGDMSSLVCVITYYARKDHQHRSEVIGTQYVPRSLYLEGHGDKSASCVIRRSVFTT